jgi:hypothetical protein
MDSFKNPLKIAKKWQLCDKPERFKEFHGNTIKVFVNISKKFLKFIFRLNERLFVQKYKG